MNALLWHARAWPVGQRPSLVGRLDKFTSGILIVAKTRAVHAELQRVMASSRCEKDYLTLVYGRVNVARVRIRLRSPAIRKIVVSRGLQKKGVPSLTAFERLGSARRLVSGCRFCAAVSTQAACTRFACTSPREGGRLWVIRNMASRHGGILWTLHLRPPSRRFPARRFTPGVSRCRILSHALPFGWKRRFHWTSTHC